MSLSSVFIFWFARRDRVPEKLDISALSPIALPMIVAALDRYDSGE